jgi:hypothetical protein
MDDVVVCGWPELSVVRGTRGLGELRRPHGGNGSAVTVVSWRVRLGDGGDSVEGVVELSGGPSFPLTLGSCTLSLFSVFFALALSPFSVFFVCFK